MLPHHVHAAIAKSESVHRLLMLTGLQVSAVAQESLNTIPYEVVQSASKPGSYELRLYQPRFVVEMPYKSRATAYMEFDKYLTGLLTIRCLSKA